MGTGERTEITEKGDLIVGKIVMGWDLISPVPIDVGIVHIHGSPVNIGTIHIHRNMQTGVQIPQRSNDPVTPPWML